MTIAEYALMINEEGWLKDEAKCDLHYILCENYDHNTFYKLPVKPSPNLPNMRSIYLYPSICFFEGTDISLGRGTDKQFQILGHPNLKNGDFSFTPTSKPGATNPPHKGVTCQGYDLTDLLETDLQKESKINLTWLLKIYKEFENKEAFFLKTGHFNRLAGNDVLKQQIIDGKSEQEIRESWQEGLVKFREIRSRYLLYAE